MAAVGKRGLVVLISIAALAVIGLSMSSGATAGEPPKFTLTVTSTTPTCTLPCDVKSIEISDNLGEFHCRPLRAGRQCAAKYPEGTVIELRAHGDAPLVLTAWGGACTGTGGCVLTMDADKTVTTTWATP